ncbi:MAG: 4-(cytidine 5'-diphospho)-2-C-methyl-D-erythritol kinase [Nitrospirae bacterium]|nr:4-(cytidine 5'-diphospho)-2-C-methyl-D-erythritol kinase [Nitrospirota bacterium]
MATRAAVAVSAPAKVNLLLRVGPKGADGYHAIFSIVQQVSLSDRLLVSARPRGIEFSSRGLTVPPGRDNLVVRAAERLRRAAGVSAGATIRLAKRIPMGAGLGGGSSDAAAVALALNRLWRLGWSRRRLAGVMAPLGSDVALFFSAPLSIVEGAGGVVRPVRDAAGRAAPHLPWWLVVVYPGLVSPTAEAYHALDRWRAEHPPASRSRFSPGPPFPLTPREREIIISRFLRGTRTSVRPLLDNDFEPVIYDRLPAVRGAADRLARSGAKGVLLSGSGSAVFGLFATLRSARTAAGAIRAAQPAWGVWVARPLRRVPPVRVVRLPI